MGLLESENSYILSDKRYVRCALCREGCSHDESHLVSTKKQEKEKIEEPQPIDLKISQNNDYLLDNQINELKNIKIEAELLIKMQLINRTESLKILGQRVCLCGHLVFEI